MLGSYRMDAQLAAPQEGLSSMKLVRSLVEMKRISVLTDRYQLRCSVGFFITEAKLM
jgi:hypothetical protein